MESFDRNAHPLQWREKISPSVKVQWTVEHLLGEAKSGLSIAADFVVEDCPESDGVQFGTVGTIWPPL